MWRAKCSKCHRYKERRGVRMLWGEGWRLPALDRSQGHLHREPDAICTVPWCMRRSHQPEGGRRMLQTGGLVQDFRQGTILWLKCRVCWGQGRNIRVDPGIDSFPLAASRESWCLMMLIWGLQLSRALCAHSKMWFFVGWPFYVEESLFLIPPHKAEHAAWPAQGLSPPLTWERFSKKEWPSVLGCFSSGVGT